MNEGIDYCYIYPKEDSSAVHIKLLEGDYKGTIFKYGKVKLQLDEKSDTMHLLFDFDVIESPDTNKKKLAKQLEFKNYIGTLLTEIMSANLDQEFIDETGNNNTEESDTQ